MERYVLVVEYKGTNFSGSQKQTEQKSIRTVQGTLEKAICTLTKQNTKTFFSGRTDAGVHSRGQTVHFDSDIDFTDGKIIYSLNGRLVNDFCKPALAFAICVSTASSVNVDAVS